MNGECFIGTARREDGGVNGSTSIYSRTMGLRLESSHGSRQMTSVTLNRIQGWYFRVPGEFQDLWALKPRKIHGNRVKQTLHRSGPRDFSEN